MTAHEYPKPGDLILGTIARFAYPVAIAFILIALLLNWCGVIELPYTATGAL